MIGFAKRVLHPILQLYFWEVISDYYAEIFFQINTKLYIDQTQAELLNLKVEKLEDPFLQIQLH